MMNGVDMKILVLAFSTVTLIWNAAPTMAQSRISDCDAALSKDYYSYASKKNLFEDYLKSIDQETYSKLTQNNKFFLEGISQYGPFKVGDDYSSFDEKRNKYLETVHYTRTREEAINIIQLTTSERAYTAYESCLRTIGEGGGLLVWASKEGPDLIDLHVKYANPANVKSILLTGDLSGGTVAGAPSGKVWPDHSLLHLSDPAKWGVNQEKVFAVRPEPGVTDTRITVRPDDGAAPIILHFRRADAELTLDFVGTHDVLRHLNQSSPTVVSPDNNENRGNCPNMVGRDSGKYCISRTPVSFSVAPPLFLKDATGLCTGGGCPFGSWSHVAAVDVGEQSATAAFDNHGSAVSLAILVNIWEHVGKDQCGGTQGPLPIRFGQSVVFSASDECMPIAVLHWKRSVGDDQGVMAFGQPTGAGGKLTRTSTTSGGGVTSAGYTISK